MFAFTKLSDFGASNPIVARIAIGLAEIVKISTLPDSQKQDLVDLISDPQSGMSFELLTAYQNRQAVINEIDAIENRLKEKFGDQPFIYTSNNFESLQNIPEILHFLKHSKAALRSAATFLGIVIGKRNSIAWEKAYRKGNFKEILKDLKKDRTEFLHLIDFIEMYAEWLKYISSLRDDDEHPKDFGGIIQNYTLISHNDACYLKRPCFKRDGSDVYEFIQASMQYLLQFCEDLSIAALADKIAYPIILEEIPENQRDPRCPKRFQITL